MELDTHELFPCVTAMWLQLPWWNSKADCITRVSKLRSSWRFLKFSEALHVYPNRFYVCNQVSQKAKGKILNWDAIANPKRAIQVQAMFSAKKKTLTGDTDDQKFNCDNADGHSQAGNRKKKLSPSWIWKTSRKNKSNEKCLETLFTHRRSNIYLQTSFYCGFDRYKVMDCFQVQLVNWRLLLFQWCKMPFKHFY